jgi:hypothetical protein
MSDLEKRLLARLTTPEEMQTAYDAGVKAEVFEEPLYRAVWNFTEEYWRKSTGKTMPTLWALQQEYPGFDRTIEGDEDDTVYLSDLLRRRFSTNQIQRILTEAGETMHSDPLGSLKILHASAYEAAEAVAPRLTRINMADNVEERRERYAKKEEFPQGMGVPFGFDLLDLHTGGVQPGELAVVGGYAKTGKSMFGIWGCTDAVRKGYKPLLYTLEMSLKECEDRVDCMFSGVSYNRMTKGQLTIAEMKTLWEGHDELRDIGGIQIERPDEGDRTVPALLTRARQYGSNYLFIDQLSHMEPGGKTQTLKEHHGTIVKQLKIEISRAGMEIPCILAAQFKREEEEINIQSFANAAEVEREADILIGLTRNKDLRQNQLMRCIILGARRGDNAEYLLNWELTDRTYFAVQSTVSGGGVLS